MLRNLIKSFFKKKLNLNLLVQIEKKNVEPVQDNLSQKLNEILKKYQSKQQFMSQFHNRLKSHAEWQIRLRYLILLHRLMKVPEILQLIKQFQMHEFTSNLQNAKGKFTMNFKSATDSAQIYKKINQYIVEPFYNYLLRMSTSTEIYSNIFQSHDQTLTNISMIQIFKITNLINILFELRQPCKYMLCNFVHVYLIEQFTTIIYEQIMSLYNCFRNSIEKYLETIEQLNQTSLIELEALIKEDKIVYNKIHQFHFLFQNFSKSINTAMPRALRIESNKIRKLFYNEKINEINSFKSHANSKKDIQRTNRSKSKSKQLIQQLLKKSVYQEDISTIIEAQNQFKAKQNVLKNSRRERKWVEDDSKILSEEENSKKQYTKRISKNVKTINSIHQLDI